MKSIIPRDDVFFDEFDQLAGLVVDGTVEIQALLSEGDRIEERARRIKAIESEADEVVHRTMDHLHRTFVTPLERNEIHKLLSRLDSVVDLAEAAAARVALYRPARILPAAPQMAGVLVSGAGQIRQLVGLLRNLKRRGSEAEVLLVEINRMENEADAIYREALGRLFVEEQDTRELIKWKDILERLEAATDCCEDVADVVAGIVLEHT